MKRETRVAAVVVAVVVGLVFGAGFGTAGADTGPAEMELKTEAGKKPAVFPHQAHQEMYSCGECHHAMGEDGKQAPYTEGMEIQTCVSCHNQDLGNPKLDDFKDVGHAQCKECHKAAKAEGKEAPTGCKGCHP